MDDFYLMMLVAFMAKSISIVINVYKGTGK